jgi:hypothetical protein
VNELYRPSSRRLSAKLVLTFAAWRISTTVISVFLLSSTFLPSSYKIVLRMLSGPSSGPTTSQKMWWRRESNPDLWICSQEFWSLDRRPHYIAYAVEDHCEVTEQPTRLRCKRKAFYIVDVSFESQQQTYWRPFWSDGIRISAGIARESLLILSARSKWAHRCNVTVDGVSLRLVTWTKLSLCC